MELGRLTFDRAQHFLELRVSLQGFGRKGLAREHCSPPKKETSRQNRTKQILFSEFYAKNSFCLLLPYWFSSLNIRRALPHRQLSLDQHIHRAFNWDSYRSAGLVRPS